MTRIAVPFLLLLLPGGLAGQQFELTAFTAQDQAGGAEPRVGGAAAVYSGPMGLRAGGSVDVPSTPLAPVFDTERADGIRSWGADLELVLSGGRAGLRLGTLEPSLFAGLGARGVRRAPGDASVVPVVSYGVGAAVPLASWLALDAGARYRVPLQEDDGPLPPPGLEAGWELQAGLALRIGSRSRPGAPSARGVSASAGRSGSGGTGGWEGRRVPQPRSSAVVRATTLQTADRYVGVPYVWGGNTPEEGFDCSGFVRYVFARNGIRLPRVSRDQAGAGRRVSTRLRDLREGDLLFFAGSDGRIDHVALYVGDGRIIHAASSRGRVAYDDLGSRRARWFADNIVAARRVIPEGTSWHFGAP